MIDRAGIRQILNDARFDLGGRTRTPVEIARELSCSPDAIAGLVRLGYLQGTTTPVGLRVCSVSAEKFNSEYISLSSIAKVLHTSTRRLMRVCDSEGIQMIMAPMPRQGPQPFVGVSDRAQLEIALQSWKQR